MPRKQIVSFSIDYMQVLDEQGAVDASLDPGLSDDELLELYRYMVLAREVDQRMLKMQRQGRMGTFPLNTGQEAAVCGSALAMGERDWLVGSYRELGARLMRGEPVERVLQYYGGYEEGNTQPATSRITPTAVILASQLPHAVGIAYAMQQLGEPETSVVAFIGDGATSQGDFHEALNFAAVWATPVVFFCQNNQWAISHPRSEQTRSETIAQKALAYGMPGIQVDGNDALAVYAATREALERARAGLGPTLIEAVTYRLLMHTTADDPTKYRAREEEERWWKRDPLVRMLKYLKDKGILNDEGQAALLEEVTGQVAQAVKRYESMGQIKPDTAFDHVLATPGEDLEAQRDEVLRRLEAGEVRHG